jgi:mono/diheme cytochrome c family protein
MHYLNLLLDYLSAITLFLIDLINLHLLISLCILTAISVVLYRFRQRIGLFWSSSLFLVSTILFLQHGFNPGVPAALILLFGGTGFLALLLYVTSSEEAQQSVWSPIKAIIVDPNRKVTLYLLLLALPGVVAFQTYISSLPSTDAPPRIRSVHPPPPNSIKVKTPGMKEAHSFDVIKDDSPIRALEASDPDAFAEHVARGKVVYYENCYFCHGDTLAADGHYASKVNPLPANFQDPGVLPQLTEAFLYWRVTKGGPGMPDAGGPWDSTMPAWEKFLSEDDMWNVIAFLYDYTGFKPRAAESVEDH